MTDTKSPAPMDRMGVYKRLSDVPIQHRLGRYGDAYANRDTWAAFVASRSDEFDSEWYQATCRKAEQSWKAHISDRGRHHALGRPVDVETWCTALATTRTLGTVYSVYWVRLEEFYTWLQMHTEHPHVYQPVLMAAAHHDTARAVWKHKLASAGKEVSARD